MKARNSLLNKIKYLLEIDKFEEILTRAIFFGLRYMALQSFVGGWAYKRSNTVASEIPLHSTKNHNFTLLTWSAKILSLPIIEGYSVQIVGKGGGTTM